MKIFKIVYSPLVQDFIVKARIKTENIVKTTRYDFVASLNGIKKVTGKIGQNGQLAPKNVEVGRKLGLENVMQSQKNHHAKIRTVHGTINKKNLVI